MKTKELLKTLLMVAAFAGLMGSCATQRQQHEHQTHVVNADTLASEASHDGHSSQHRQDVDSLVAEAVSRAIAEYARSEQEHEVTTETLTETIDSLGRVIRQQQRTTDRTLSRQEQSRQQQEIREMRASLQRHIEMQDSAWAEKFARFESHLRDSLDQVADKQQLTNAAPALSWWQRLWHNLWMIVAGVVTAGVLFATRRLWMPLLRRLF